MDVSIAVDGDYSDKLPCAGCEDRDCPIRKALGDTRLLECSDAIRQISARPGERLEISGFEPDTVFRIASGMLMQEHVLEDGRRHVAAFKTDEVEAVVTWNPLLSEIAAEPGAKVLYTSGDIPGEIIDMLVVNTETLADNPDFGKALVGAWYELMAIMSSDSEDSTAARTAMAEASGTDLAGYKAQLDSTEMFYAPADAVTFTESGDLPKTMKFVAEFLFDKGILGEGAPSPEFVGVSFPDGSVYGDEANVKLRFDTTFMKMAADGAL